MLRAPAIDQGAVGQVWLHNPAAYDADGDSLAYRLRTCQQVVGGPSGVANTGPQANLPQPQVCLGYVYPNDPSITPTAFQVAFAGTPSQGIPAGVPGSAAIIVQDPYNGQITWNAPSRAGQYNIAFEVEEWRRTPFGKLKIGTVIRDMQIIIKATLNTPPSLTVPPDLCVVANTPVTFNVSAVDGSSNNNPPSNVALFAYSGIIPPATFIQNNTGSSVTGTFRWTPDCSNVAALPYVVVFKAQDSPANPNTTPILIDEKPVRITVIGPPPQNLQAAPVSGLPVLTNAISWNQYTCQNASQILIYRKENPSGWSPGNCETGIPASAGYTRIGAVPVSATTFADNNAGAGLTRGRNYCYRIYAVFPLPAGGASIASAEACVTIGGRSARLKNVDVDVTGAAGQITVRWTPPRPTNANVPYLSPGYRLARGEGSAPTTFVPIATFTGLQDSSYVDTGIDTQTKQYTYQLTFTYQETVNGAAANREEIVPVASSVRLSLVPRGLAKTMQLSWNYNVPWDNSKQPTLVYRNDGNGGTTYTQIGTATSGATSGTYTDTGLTIGKEYCYYVQTNGQYADATPAAGLAYLTNLLNKSQRSCATLRDVPCTPVLSILPTNCDSLAAAGTVVTANQRYTNKLTWTVGNTPAGCAANAVYYRVLRAGTSAGPFVAIDSTTQLSYADRNLTQANYCYVVQGVSADKVRSDLSNVACQDGCLFFELPNVFTPNGDGINDTFRPKSASGIQRTSIQIFNRWGRKVYESDQYPYIDWSGGGKNGETGANGMVSGGLYYFLAEVTFTDAAHTTRTFKGWVEVIR